LIGADAYSTRVLLEHGAEVNATNQDKATALHYSTDIEVAKILLSYAANVNAVDKGGYSALYYYYLNTSRATGPFIHILKQRGARMTRADKVAMAAEQIRDR